LGVEVDDATMPLRSLCSASHCLTISSKGEGR